MLFTAPHLFSLSFWQFFNSFMICHFRHVDRLGFSRYFDSLITRVIMWSPRQHHWNFASTWPVKDYYYVLYRVFRNKIWFFDVHFHMTDRNLSGGFLNFQDFLAYFLLLFSWCQIFLKVCLNESPFLELLSWFFDYAYNLFISDICYKVGNFTGFCHIFHFDQISIN